MLTSDKWRQARPRDLRTLSRAVHLPQLKSEAGSSQGTSTACPLSGEEGETPTPSSRRGPTLPVWASESYRAEGEGRLE